ncbi:MAG: type IV pilin-like G/H family protein [Cyanobacteria bacterium P01_H01_bin.58]
MMKLNFARPTQFGAIAVLTGLTMVGCGASEVVENLPEDVAEAVPEDVAEAVDSSVDEALQLEGKTTLGSMVRGQQAYFLEFEKFASTVDDLGLGLSPESERYTYAIVTADDTQVISTATAKQDGFKSYSAAVFTIDDTTVKGVCEADTPGSVPPEAPELSGTEVTCPAGSTLVD